MIGQISGLLIEKQAPGIVIDIGGIGYEIRVPMTTFYVLPSLGSTIRLYTHFVVREDAQLLYGFAEERDRALFRSLIRVNGVGPKLGLTILSGMDGNAFASCVLQGDSAALVKLPGVGKKTAERLVIEMKDRLKDWDVPVDVLACGSADGGVRADAESALVALGYKTQEASRAIAAVNDNVSNSEELIRLALQSMVKI
jgi:Holliday junction DNA helicase RuvA